MFPSITAFIVNALVQICAPRAYLDILACTGRHNNLGDLLSILPFDAYCFARAEEYSQTFRLPRSSGQYHKTAVFRHDSIRRVRFLRACCHRCEVKQGRICHLSRIGISLGAYGRRRGQRTRIRFGIGRIGNYRNIVLHCVFRHFKFNSRLQYTLFHLRPASYVVRSRSVDRIPSDRHGFTRCRCRKPGRRG